MPDALVSRPELPFAATPSGRGVVIVPAPGHILHVMARRGAAIPTERLAGLGDGSALAVRAIGPGQWLIVGDAPLPPADVAARAAAVADVASLFDSSEGRVRLTATGPGSVDLLSSGSGLDLRLRAFPPGATAATQWRHFALVVTRTGPEGFELIVARSFARSLWDEMSA